MNFWVFRKAGIFVNGVVRLYGNWVFRAFGGVFGSNGDTIIRGLAYLNRK